MGHISLHAGIWLKTHIKDKRYAIYKISFNTPWLYGLEYGIGSKIEISKKIYNLLQSIQWKRNGI